MLLSYVKLPAQHEQHLPAPEKAKKEAVKNKDKSPVKNQKTEQVDLLTAQNKQYHLYLTDTIVNFTGKSRHAIAANGSIPMPTLIFTEGDTAEIYVHNMLKKETSVHWHGVLLPNQFDGVPYLTQMPIKPGETYLSGDLVSA